ncbi:hypothetical protein EVAR_60064_1 [Eumeta japonica]|uniref:Uncharacterized protein n=1 Tax=Eumeta variegata TaxID=151549 RepID=A0A4C1ZL64_EUMVA|nr:hypothetical protein EVAR_60064_1 [Eumeta japonica]
MIRSVLREAVDGRFQTAIGRRGSTPACVGFDPRLVPARGRRGLEVELVRSIIEKCRRAQTLVVSIDYFVRKTNAFEGRGHADPMTPYKLTAEVASRLTALIEVFRSECSSRRSSAGWLLLMTVVTSETKTLRISSTTYRSQFPVYSDFVATFLNIRDATILL